MVKTPDPGGEAAVPRGGLTRRTRLIRTGAPQRRTRLTATAGYRIPQIGAARRRQAPDRAATIAVVYVRDGGCVLARAGLDHVYGPCWGPLTPHHLRKANKGPGWYPSNIVTLCAGHNGAIEDHPHEAHEHGLVIWDGDTHAEAWERMAAVGIGAL